MPTSGFFTKDGAPFFGHDHDDDGGFEQRQLLTASDFAQLVAGPLAAPLTIPLSLFLPDPITAKQHALVWAVPPNYNGALIRGVYFAVGSAPTGAPLVLDVNVNGTTVYTDQSTRPTMSAGATLAGGVIPQVDTIAAFPARLTVDVDQVGAGCTDLSVVILLDAATPAMEGFA